MLLNQDTLKFVFGMKLRGLRLDKGLSLKDLSKKTGLSPSYLNEIEKGKKYPKTEKITLLADALDEKHEDLVSLELKRDLQIVQNLIDKKIMNRIPFDMFGIPVATIFELLSERPKQTRALVGTLLEIARAHNIKIDDLFLALLRSYINMNDNYFPQLEEASREVSQNFQIDWSQPSHELKEKLITSLNAFKVTVLEKELTEVSSELSALSYFMTKGKKFYLSPRLDIKEQLYILAREIGYQHLKLKERPMTSLLVNLDSFATVLNLFSASYFANSLLIPECEIHSDLKNLFAQNSWNGNSIKTLVDKYNSPPEAVFHRITHIMPKHFGITQLFFLRNVYDKNTNKHEIARELHLAKHHSPHRIIGNHENICSRWLVHRLVKSHQDSKQSQIAIQRSTFSGSENEYVVFGMSLERKYTPQAIDSLCIGFVINDSLKSQVMWSKDQTIPTINVGETCQRCLYTACPDRLAPLQAQYDPEKYDHIFHVLAKLND